MSQRWGAWRHARPRGRIRTRIKVTLVLLNSSRAGTSTTTSKSAQAHGGDELNTAAGAPRGEDARTVNPNSSVEHGDLFRRVFEDAPIAMAIVGLDGRILRPNAAFLKMTGFSRDEILFMEPEEFAHPDDAGLNAQQMQRALTGEGDCYQIDKRWSNALGHTLWVVVSASLVRDSKRRPLYFVWHVQDWSVRKRE